jgi:biopolymer transport protein TolR
MQTTGGGHGSGGGSSAAATYLTMRSRRSEAPIGEINVTPLVDVVLVLLLVFMVTAPMMDRGIDVTLPVARSQNPEQERVTITLDAKQRVFLGDRLTTLPLLGEELKTMMQGRPLKVVYLRADQSLAYGRVIEVVDTIKRAGVEQIGFVYVMPGDRPAPAAARTRS